MQHNKFTGRWFGKLVNQFRSFISKCIGEHFQHAEGHFSASQKTIGLYQSWFTLFYHSSIRCIHL